MNTSSECLKHYPQMAIFPKDELSRTIRDEPPTHFTLKIESFSLLSNSSLERYNSGNFIAGGYTWKLCLYPDGNKDRNGEDHISLCLEMVETDSLSPGWEVHALFRFSVLDQLRDNYLFIQDASGIPKRFRATKIQSGFDRFMTLKEFNDPTKGYLVNDTCVFGAEVFVHKESLTGNGECLSMTAEPLTCNHTWKIERFSQLDKESYLSPVFTTGDLKWEIIFYPKGNAEEEGKSLSLFLKLDDITTFLPDRGVYLDFQLRVVDQINGKHKENKLQHWFKESGSWGFRNFLPLSSFLDQSNGYLVKDVCIIEAHLLLIGTIKKLFPKSE
ncbi:hypothetical protein NE237_032609 [Protea cynaroides]|uniref:MATH domain-containing protein n=1 Tax=Protea cynaroides TaxID=273540 RepID=A0A9Q0L3F7_9MAGN|nr:hypothetical protein NE237_032609 [Protea cynaroides]